MKSFDGKAMGARIRRKRQEFGLSQKEMADSLGLSLSFYGHIERGMRVPSLPTLVTIANRLGTGIDALMKDSLDFPCLPQKQWTNRQLGIFRQFLEHQGEEPDDWFAREEEE